MEAVLARFERIALHARKLGFEHPVNGTVLSFERPPPASFEDLFAQLSAANGLEPTSFINR
jgi:hypothetical protein